MKNWISRGILTLGLAVAGASLAQPALAVNWASSSSPLKAYQNGVAQGAAYGNFYNKSYVWAASLSIRRDLQPGGDGVFVHTTYRYATRSCHQCNIEYTKQSHDRTNNTTSSAWQSATYTDRLNPSSNSARGVIHVCEDHSWAADSCSVNALPTFSY